MTAYLILTFKQATIYLLNFNSEQSFNHHFFFFFTIVQLQGLSTIQGSGLQNEDVERAYRDRTRAAYYEDM